MIYYQITNYMKSKSNKWVCVIVLDGVEVLNKEFLSLEDIGDEIGLSKNICYDISSKKTTHKKYKNCKYFPVITINRLP